MDSFDQRVREGLLAMTPDWQARAAEMALEVQTMYEEKMKRAAFWHWAGSGAGVFLIIASLPALVIGLVTGNAAIAVIGGMVFLMGDGWIGFSKLLYWTWNSRIRLERDIKETRGDVLDLLQRFERLEARFSGDDGSQAGV